MKKTRKLISLLLCVVLVVSMMSVAMFSASAATNPYSNAAMALDAEYAYDGELGALYSPEATTFKVWAPLATEVKLNRYATGSDAEEGAQDLGSVEMEKLMDGEKWTGVWTTTVDGDIVNTYYTYTITNPNHIYNSTATKTVESQDVYSYAVGVNGDRSMVVDLSKTDPEGWESDKHVFTDKQSQAIIWEVHVKDFSYAENSGVSEANRGKFLGFTETGTTLDNEGVISTGIDYLKSLGVTHVQINPMYDFATIDESGDPTQFNWGYDPKNYGVPEGSYSTNPFDGNVRIRLYDLITDQFFDSEYYLTDLAGRNYEYSYLKMKLRDKAPVFPADTVVSTSVNENGETILTFTGAKDRYVVESYKVSVTRAGVPFAADNFSGKYMYLFEEDKYDVNLGKLESGKTYKAKIVAMNAYAETSAPFTYTFTAE